MQFSSWSEREELNYQVGVKALRLNTLLKGVHHRPNNKLLLLPQEGLDPKEAEAGVPKEEEEGAAAVGCPNSNMVPLLIIKVGEGEGLLSKEAVEDMAVAEVVVVVVWAVAVALVLHMVDEKKGSGGVVMGLGGPTMHDGAVAEIGGCGFESGPGEGIPQVPVTPSGEAQTPPTATTHLFTLF